MVWPSLGAKTAEEEEEDSTYVTFAQFLTARANAVYVSMALAVCASVTDRRTDGNISRNSLELKASAMPPKTRRLPHV